MQEYVFTNCVFAQLAKGFSALFYGLAKGIEPVWLGTSEIGELSFENEDGPCVVFTTQHARYVCYLEQNIIAPDNVELREPMLVNGPLHFVGTYAGRRFEFWAGIIRKTQTCGEKTRVSTSLGQKFLIK